MTSSPYYIDLQKLAKHVTTLGSDSLFYTSFPNRKKNRIGETPDRDLPKLAPIHNGSLPKSHKMEEKSQSSMINTHQTNILFVTSIHQFTNPQFFY